MLAEAYLREVSTYAVVCDNANVVDVIRNRRLDVIMARVIWFMNIIDGDGLTVPKNGFAFVGFKIRTFEADGFTILLDWIIFDDLTKEDVQQMVNMVISMTFKEFPFENMMPTGHWGRKGSKWVKEIWDVCFQEHVCITALKDCAILAINCRPHSSKFINHPAFSKVVMKGTGHQPLDLEPSGFKLLETLNSNPGFKFIAQFNILRNDVDLKQDRQLDCCYGLQEGWFWPHCVPHLFLVFKSVAEHIYSWIYSIAVLKQPQMSMLSGFTSLVKPHHIKITLWFWQI